MSDKLRESASQTAGPYVHIGCMPNNAGIRGVYPQDLGGSPFSGNAKGEVITIEGHVFDGDGAPVGDAMVESWQADAAGLYPGEAGADPAVSGFGRMACNPETGAFTLTTIKPGGRGGSAPFISLWIAARGINIGLQTRIYFPDLEADKDPLLSSLNEDQRATLIAGGSGANYSHTIRLQGDGETVFLDI